MDPMGSNRLYLLERVWIPSKRCMPYTLSIQPWSLWRFFCFRSHEATSCLYLGVWQTQVGPLNQHGDSQDLSWSLEIKRAIWGLFTVPETIIASVWLFCVLSYTLSWGLLRSVSVNGPPFHFSFGVPMEHLRNCMAGRSRQGRCPFLTLYTMAPENRLSPWLLSD